MEILNLILIAVPVLVFSIALHEMVHALVSDALGDDTARVMGRITINPIHHIDPLTTVALPLVLLFLGLPPIGAAKPVPFNPSRVKYEEFGVALVAVAGPLTNLLLAIAFGLLGNLVSGGGFISQLLEIGLYINIGFFVFNMIPFPPLDGSRVLYAFAPSPLQRFMEAIESYGLASILIFMFFLFPYIRPLIIGANEFFIRILQ